MYPKASPFSLALAMLVQDQVLSLLSELTFLQKKKDQNQDEATASSCLMLATALDSHGNNCIFLNIVNYFDCGQNLTEFTFKIGDSTSQRPAVVSTISHTYTVLCITLVVNCIYFINLPVVNRRPSSGTKNTTLETHACNSPLLGIVQEYYRRIVLFLHLPLVTGRVRGVADQSRHCL